MMLEGEYREACLRLFARLAEEERRAKEALRLAGLLEDDPSEDLP